jgi:hypothetical protein
MHWTLRNKPWSSHWHLFTDYGSLCFSFLISRITTITYKKFVFRTDQSFHNPWRIIWFATRVTQWVSHVEQNCLPFQSTPSFSGVRVVRSTVVCVVFCRSLFIILSLSFFHYIVCHLLSIYGIWLPLLSSIYGIWLPLLSSICGIWLPLLSSIYGIWLPLLSSIYGLWLPLLSSIYDLWLPLLSSNFSYNVMLDFVCLI